MRSILRRAVVVAAAASGIWALGSAAANAATPAGAVGDALGTVAGAAAPAGGAVHGFVHRAAGAVSGVAAAPSRAAARTAGAVAGKAAGQVGGAVQGATGAVRGLAGDAAAVPLPGSPAGGFGSLTGSVAGVPGRAATVAASTVRAVPGFVPARRPGQGGGLGGYGSGVPVLPGSADLARGALAAGSRPDGLGRAAATARTFAPAGLPVPAVLPAPGLPVPLVPGVLGLVPPLVHGVVLHVGFLVASVLGEHPVLPDVQPLACPPLPVRALTGHVVAVGRGAVGAVRPTVTVVRGELPASPAALPELPALPSVPRI